MQRALWGSLFLSAGPFPLRDELNGQFCIQDWEGSCTFAESATGRKKKICIFPFSLENEASSPESQLSICKSTRAKGWENARGRCSHTVLTPRPGFTAEVFHRMSSPGSDLSLPRGSPGQASQTSQIHGFGITCETTNTWINTWITRGQAGIPGRGKSKSSCSLSCLDPWRLLTCPAHTSKGSQRDGLVPKEAPQPSRGQGCVPWAWECHPGMGMPWLHGNAMAAWKCHSTRRKHPEIHECVRSKHCPAAQSMARSQRAQDKDITPHGRVSPSPWQGWAWECHPSRRKYPEIQECVRSRHCPAAQSSQSHLQSTPRTSQPMGRSPLIHGKDIPVQGKVTPSPWEGRHTCTKSPEQKRSRK